MLKPARRARAPPRAPRAARFPFFHSQDHIREDRPMKLYISPGACSLSPHIVFREAGIPFDTETVDLGAKRTKSGKDFNAINPKGYVPALELEGGQVLTEGPAIVQYIADQKPASKL